jgi:hypothetical protein
MNDLPPTPSHGEAASGGERPLPGSTHLPWEQEATAWTL